MKKIPRLCVFLVLIFASLNLSAQKAQILNAEPKNDQDTVRSYPNTPPPPNNQITPAPTPGSTSPNNSNDNNNLGKINPSLENNSGNSRNTLPDTTEYRRNSNPQINNGSLQIDRTRRDSTRSTP